MEPKFLPDKHDSDICLIQISFGLSETTGRKTEAELQGDQHFLHVMILSFLICSVGRVMPPHGMLGDLLSSVIRLGDSPGMN